MPTFNNIEFRYINEINNYEKRHEYQNLISTIDLSQNETYNCTNLNVWSYRKAGDIREGVNIRFGNMVNGFPLTVGGVRFNHSEAAYISGLFAGNNTESIRIQGMLSEDRNGLWCKKTYRNLLQYSQFGRKDFYSYNVQWMMYVLWLKSSQNELFADLLRSLPIDCHVVENTSYHKGETATFWGAKNPALESERKIKIVEVKKNGVFRTKKDLAEAQMTISNSINDIGVFIGQNVMGKIIKIMSLSLLYGQEPRIDYNLLENKELYMLGRRINFI